MDRFTIPWPLAILVLHRIDSRLALSSSWTRLSQVRRGRPGGRIQSADGFLPLWLFTIRCMAVFAGTPTINHVPGGLLHTSLRHLHFASRHHLTVPRHRLSTFCHRAFSVAGPVIWNSLPDGLHDPGLSIDCLRQLLKMNLFQHYRWVHPAQ